MTLPITHQAYRDVTNDCPPLNLRTKVCAGCKKARSVGQFAPGHTKCNQCRGIK